MNKSAALLALLLASCHANEAPPEIEVEDAWARATVAGQTGSAAYLTIHNSGGGDKLLSVATPAGNASLHSTSMDNGVMRMRPLQTLEIPANSVVTLKPGAIHLMLMGLKQPLAEGSAIELDLRFEKSGERLVTAEVRPASGEAM